MKKSFIVGIAGGSGSGKSTIAEKIVAELILCRIKIFAMDSYYKPEDRLPLTTAKNGKQYRDYNCPDSFELGQMKRDIQEANGKFDIIIIEGILTLWENEIFHLCNLRVFMDCPADIRILRRIKRNLTWGLSIDDITDVYLNLVRYRHEEYVEPTKKSADLIIDSSIGIDEIFKHILDTLPS